MMLVPERQYAEIIRDLEKFEAYVVSLKLRHAPERLRHLTANLRKIEEARAQNRTESLNKRRDVAELVWSLVEGVEFADIFRGISGYDRAVMKRLLQKALQGPPHPIDETNSSNIGRNTVFELRLGAALRRAGAMVTLGQRADVLINHAGTHIYIECKRPFYEYNIRKNVEKAWIQLQRRFAADPHPASVGLVAISVSKSLNPGLKWFEVEYDEDLQQLSDEANRIHQQYCSDYDKLADCRLIGIIYHLFTPALVKRRGLLTAASQYDIFLETSSFEMLLPVSGEPLKKFLSCAFGKG